MKNNNIDFNTQIQIRKYMNFLWENGDKQIYKNDHELFSKLSENLKYLFLSQATGKYISSLPLFSKNFSKEFLKEIIFIMKPVTFDPNAIIYEVSNKIDVFSHEF